MSIATFSPPIKATAKEDSLPRILLGLGETDDGNPYLVAVNSDGVIELLLLADVTVNWRYDPKTELWSDTDTEATERPFGDAEDG